MFEPKTLEKIVKAAVAAHPTLEERIDAVYKGLIAEYGSEVIQGRPGDDWYFNVAGTAAGAMQYLYISPSEYLIVFGTPIGTSGFSGRFHVTTDYFCMLEGQQIAFNAGDLKREEYNAGDCHVLPAGEAQMYSIPEHGFALEYARGSVVAMLPFGAADALFSTLDFQTLFLSYAKATVFMVDNLMKGHY